jgi:Rod binding domain-containing protein
MHIPPLQSHVKAADIPFDQLAGNKSIPENEKIAEVCRQFEAVLLRQILKDARKDVWGSQQNQDQATSGIYSDMINNQLADSISRSGTFGLAKSLQSQLARQVSSSSTATHEQSKSSNDSGLKSSH